MKTVIEGEGISFSYNKNMDVLSDICFDVSEQDFVGLIGPNGGGKSTLLKIIVGLLTPDKGEIKVFGGTPESARNKIGYVPQYSQIDLDYPISVWEIVISGLLGRKSLGSGYNDRDRKKTMDVLEEMKLVDLKDVAVGELSGGQRQRVLLSRALVRSPKLLLLDEPRNNVDRESGNDLYKLLHKLNKEITVFIVSHDIGTVSKYVNKLFCLNKTMVCNKAKLVGADCCGKDLKHVIHKDDCNLT